MATEKDNVNGALIATICLAGAVVVFALVLALTAYTRAEVKEEAIFKESYANLGAKRRFIQAEHDALGAPASWEDKEAQVVRIPLGHAKALVVRDIAANPLSATLGAEPPPPVDAVEGAPTGEESTGGSGVSPESPAADPAGGAQ